MSKVVLIFLIAALVTNCVSLETLLRRTKRYIVYPRGGSFKIVIGVATPVKLGLKQSMSASVNLQFQYVTAQNITQLQHFPPIVLRSQEKRSVRRGDRMTAYLGLEAILSRYGINGRACLLRSICENAFSSVYHKANGIYGHLIHIFLSPDYGDGEYDPDLEEAFIDAQKAGYYGVDCFSLHIDCPYGHGLLDIMSVFE